MNLGVGQGLAGAVEVNILYTAGANCKDYDSRSHFYIVFEFASPLIRN